MLRLTCQHVHDEGFTASKFLLNNQNEDISREAADLISDRYQLSSGNQMTQSEEELKVAYLTRLLLDYKNAIIEEELKQCNSDLTRPEVKNDIDLTLNTMRRIKELSEIQRQLAKILGDRVIVK
jgi:DNA primase